MRSLPRFVVLGALVGCTAQGPNAKTEWDMGPMPPVAALYDAAGPPATLEERDYYFTRDLAEAMSKTPLDLYYRFWAEGGLIEAQTFGLSETPPDDRAVVVTRFGYPGRDDGMIVSYTLCRAGPSQWQIEDVSGEAVTAAPSADEAPSPSLRARLGLPARSAACD